MLVNIRVNEVVAVLGKVSQYRVAEVLVSLDDFEAVDEGAPVLMRLQLVGQIVVVETLMPVVPQLYDPLVYPYITLDIRSAVLQGQDVVFRADAGLSHVSAGHFLRVRVIAFAGMEFRTVREQVVHHGI